jgi:hypothetical protein
VEPHVHLEVPIRHLRIHLRDRQPVARATGFGDPFLSDLHPVRVTPLQ